MLFLSWILWAKGFRLAWNKDATQNIQCISRNRKALHNCTHHNDNDTRLAMVLVIQGKVINNCSTRCKNDSPQSFEVPLQNKHYTDQVIMKILDLCHQPHKHNYIIGPRLWTGKYAEDSSNKRISILQQRKNNENAFEAEKIKPTLHTILDKRRNMLQKSEESTKQFIRDEV